MKKTGRAIAMILLAIAVATAISGCRFAFQSPNGEVVRTTVNVRTDAPSDEDNGAQDNRNDRQNADW